MIVSTVFVTVVFRENQGAKVKETVHESNSKLLKITVKDGGKTSQNVQIRHNIAAG